MGWFDGWWSGSAKSSDPFSSVDPKVREFLQRESPVKYETEASKSASSSSPTGTLPSQHGGSAATTEARTGTAATEGAAAPIVPKESLFQDGRYAHLWKGYKSRAEVESETKTDHEKLMDVLEGFKDRKQQIGRAALENCALQQEEWINCMKDGSWEDRLQMCRKQVQKFERCYTMQTRLLRALGYASSPNRSVQVEEKVQMHADKLYERMLEQEKVIKAAKEQGLEPPELKDLFATGKAAPVAPSGADIEPGAELRKTWDETLSKLPPEERAAEEAALRADLQAKAAMAKDVQKLWDEQAAERKARENQGAATMMDRVANMFGSK